MHSIIIFILFIHFHFFTLYLFIIIIVIIIIITITIFIFIFILFIHSSNRKLLELFRLQNVKITLDWMVELYNLVSLSWLLKSYFVLLSIS